MYALCWNMVSCTGIVGCFCQGTGLHSRICLQVACLHNPCLSSQVSWILSYFVDPSFIFNFFELHHYALSGVFDQFGWSVLYHLYQYQSPSYPPVQLIFLVLSPGFSGTPCIFMVFRLLCWSTVSSCLASFATSALLSVHSISLAFSFSLIALTYLRAERL